MITFTDDYLQPGLIKHNRPLFISGYLNGLEITRIMIDGGSAVNLLPLRMLKRLGGLLFIDWPQAIYLSKDLTKVGRGLPRVFFEQMVRKVSSHRIGRKGLTEAFAFLDVRICGHLPLHLHTLGPILCHPTSNPNLFSPLPGPMCE